MDLEWLVWLLQGVPDGASWLLLLSLVQIQDLAAGAVVSRWRLVTVQGGKEHVSTVVSGPDEIDHDLVAEAELHRMAGWKVTTWKRDGQIHRVSATKDGVRRELFFREYEAMEDI